MFHPYNTRAKDNLHYEIYRSTLGQRSISKVLNHDNSFSEFILLEISCKENTKLTLGVFGRPLGQAYAIGNPSVCPSVRPSVCGQTA